MYGGIGMLNTPLNDAWILTIKDDLSIHWNPYYLPYDHGKYYFSKYFMKQNKNAI